MKQTDKVNALLGFINSKLDVALYNALNNNTCRELVVEGIDEALGAPIASKEAYERRGRNGGLTDPNLIAVTTEKSKKVASGTYCATGFLKSTAQGNSDWRGGVNPPPSKRNPQANGKLFYVDCIVSDGKGYSWKGSSYHKNSNHPNRERPRPIYEEAAKKLTENGELGRLVSDELHKALQ